MKVSGTAALDALEAVFRQSLTFRNWLHTRRWCGDTVGPRTELAVKDRALLVETPAEVVAFFLAVAREGGVSHPMHVPLSITMEKPEPEAFELSAGGERFYVTEAERGDAYARFLVDGFRDRLSVRTRAGDSLRFHGEPVGAFRSVDPFADDRSSVLVRIATTTGSLAFKSYKRLEVGNREADLLQRLHKKGFPHVARYRGELALGVGADRLVLGVATDHVDATDAFSWLTAGWRDERARDADGDFERTSLEFSARLGEATARLHDALADHHAGPFRPEVFTEEDAEATTRAALGNLSDSLRRLAVLANGPDARAGGLAARARELVFSGREHIERCLAGILAGIGTAKCVTHADLHLGQVLRTTEGRLLFIDFEGEPERLPEKRHEKLPPLRDIATLGRSFSYVVHYAWREFIGGDASAAFRLMARDALTSEESEVAERLLAWERAASERCSLAYLKASALYPDMDAEHAVRAIRGWMMEKALYELRYELVHRPQNVFIPLDGVVSLAASHS
ncbi:MAG TPA: phosphotransferase [Thermoplasmata archaeon]|nr:phosphotransferase [Thermoplasmata archaeon]